MSKITFLQALLILLLAVTVGAGTGYLIIYYLSPSSEIGQLFTRITILLGIGLGVGLVCRFAISSRFAILKVLFSLLGSILSLLILDAFFLNSYSFLTRTKPFSEWAVGEYTQIGALLVLSLFITLFGKKKVGITPSQPSPKKNGNVTNSVNRIRSSINHNFQQLKTRISSVRRKPTVKKTLIKKKSPSPKTTSMKITKKASTSTVKVDMPDKNMTVKKTTAKKMKSSSRTFRKHAQNVRLVGIEDHRCPYCLEEVKKNDPRGVVVCPDCGTWHHKDCWDVTGSCQIAHKHAL